MRKLLYIPIFLLVIASFNNAISQQESAVNTLSPREKVDVWIPLFDGKTTNGWSIERDAKVVNGTLTIGGTKNIYFQTTKKFSSFDLTFEYKEKGNTGKIRFSNVGYSLAYDNDFALPFQGVRVADFITAKFTVISDDSTHNISSSFSRPFIDVAYGSNAIKFPDTKFPGSDSTTIGFMIKAGSELVIRNIKLKPISPSVKQ